MSISHARRKRRLDAVQDRVDRVIVADAKFFQRFPHRSHRVRLTSAAELEANAAMLGVTAMDEIPGRRWFTAVRQVVPGVRTRLFVMNAADADPDMDETNAEAVFDYLARVGGSEVKEVEKNLRAAFAKRGAQ